MATGSSAHQMKKETRFPPRRDQIKAQMFASMVKTIVSAALKFSPLPTVVSSSFCGKMMFMEGAGCIWGLRVSGPDPGSSANCEFQILFAFWRWDPAMNV
ncbi:hypothetical protein DITRI_Ditri14bG0078700 [Diplodiscus trichospermus]